MSKKYFVTRHRGAVTWAADSGVKARKVEMENFDAAIVEPGDVVMGTLPVHVAAAVNARGGHYWHLAMDVPQAWRGRELTPQQMRGFGARLEEFRIHALGARVSEAVEPSPQGDTAPRVHLCIATGQAMANVLPLRALPWKRLIVFASADMKKAAQRLVKIAESFPVDDGEPDRTCELVMMPAALDWASLTAFAAKQAARLSTSGPLDLNVTGGNKLMTLAFSEAFRSQARLLYASTADGMISVIDAVPGEPLRLAPDLIDLDAYLEVQGYRAGRRVQVGASPGFDAIRARQALTASLVLAGESMAKATVPARSVLWLAETRRAGQSLQWDEVPRRARSFLGLLHEAANAALPQRGDRARPFRAEAVLGDVRHEGLWTAVFEALEAHGLVKDLSFVKGDRGERSIEFKFADEAAATYLCGGYLEEYVLLCLDSLELPAGHVAGSVGIGLVDAATGVSDELNELDAAAVWRNQLLVVECKAGVQLTGAEGQGIVHKLDQLQDNVGGTLGKGLLVTHRRLSDKKDADVLQRAATNRIRVLHGRSAMWTLAATLASILDCPRPRVWPHAALVLPGIA